MIMKRNIVLLLLMIFSAVTIFAAEKEEIRGIWFWGTMVKNKAAADKVIANLKKMRINTIYPLVYYWNDYAVYESSLVRMHPDVEKGFNPLQYLILECHQRHIRVEPWFANSSMGISTEGKIHPDWQAVSIIGIKHQAWDFNQAGPQEYNARIMLDVAKNYDVDGLHFDYIRYPDVTYCYCTDCQARFKKKFGMEMLPPEDTIGLPIKTWFGGNCMLAVKQAKVLAEFSNGFPAITLNNYGKGTVILFNWFVPDQQNLLFVKLINNTLTMVNPGCKKPIYIVPSDRTVATPQYGRRFTQIVLEMFNALKIEYQVIADKQVKDIGGNGIFILPCSYVMSGDLVIDLEKAVSAGASLIFFDGPVITAAKNETLCNILGTTNANRFITAELTLTPVGNNPIVFHKKQELSPAYVKNLDEFRKSGISELVKTVALESKKIKPKLQITAAVRCTRKMADDVGQDWYHWLEKGWLDYSIPMAYFSNLDDFQNLFEEYYKSGYKTRIIPGIGQYLMKDEPEKVNSQIDASKKNGFPGFVLFSLENMTDKDIDRISFKKD